MITYGSREVYHLGYLGGNNKDWKKYVVDLWYDKPLFGKVDEQQNIVTVKASAVKLLSTPSPRYALNFVVDAFNRFKTRFDEAYSLRQIKKNTFLGDVTPQRAWMSADATYNAYMQRRYKAVANRINSAFSYKKVYDLGSFLKFVFVDNDMVSSTQPYTRLGYLSSVNAPIGISGLAIEVATLDVSNDVDKDFFVSDPNFGFFLWNARKHGFLVDKNCPWRLVANPASTVMTEYMKPYGIDGYFEMFDKNFLLAYKDDFEVFKLMSTMFYESYRRANPSFKFGDVCLDRAQPDSRVYRLTRKTLEQSGVTDDDIFFYYLIARFMEYSHDRHHAIKESRKFLRGYGSKTVGQRVEILNEQLNKHVDVNIRKLPGSGACIKHRMPDGTIMQGPVHGPGQVCVEWAQAGSATTAGGATGGGYSGGGSGGY
jgi:hypothetical protein